MADWNLTPTLTLTPTPTLALKKEKRKMFWLEFGFESYFEVDNAVWGKHGCISEDYDSFVQDKIFLHGWQAGAKMSLYV